jgi:hypothetical protein
VERRKESLVTGVRMPIEKAILFENTWQANKKNSQEVSEQSSRRCDAGFF